MITFAVALIAEAFWLMNSNMGAPTHGPAQKLHRVDGCQPAILVMPEAPSPGTFSGTPLFSHSVMSAPLSGLEK